MQSMTDEAILNAWHSMRSEADMQPLTNAAVCRSESDWLVGLNSTRALTILQSRGGFNVTPAGRVQTPTLAILTQRELEIQAFEPVSTDPWSTIVPPEPSKIRLLQAFNCSFVACVPFVEVSPRNPAANPV
jgi:topB: DNA topoisomerase III